jgi:hypothetical protein
LRIGDTVERYRQFGAIEGWRSHRCRTLGDGGRGARHHVIEGKYDDVRRPETRFGRRVRCHRGERQVERAGAAVHLARHRAKQGRRRLRSRRHGVRQGYRKKKSGKQSGHFGTTASIPRARVGVPGAAIPMGGPVALARRGSVSCKGTSTGAGQ